MVVDQLGAGLAKEDEARIKRAAWVAYTSLHLLPYEITVLDVAVHRPPNLLAVAGILFCRT